MEYGAIRGESNAYYHGQTAISASSFKTFIKSPYLFFKRHIERSCPQEETAAMRIGSATHEFILEPEKFEAHYKVLPDDFNGRTKEGKAEIDAIEASGKVAMRASEFEDILAMRDGVLSNKTAAVLLSSGEAEISWRTKYKDLTLQSRTDWFIESATPEQVSELIKYGIDIKAGQPVIVDLKTTAELDAWFRDNYGNAIHQYGYQLQLAFYLQVVNKVRKEQGKEIVRHFLFIVVEKSAPYDCAVVVLDEATFALAQTQTKHHLKRMVACLANNDWQGYKDRGVIVTGVPAQIASREEQEIFEKTASENPANW
jgi:hypothetical protein